VGRWTFVRHGPGGSARCLMGSNNEVDRVGVSAGGFVAEAFAFAQPVLVAALMGCGGSCRLRLG
jgi:pimeloyl-ACP methyl ester carboxylesterase